MFLTYGARFVRDISIPPFILGLFSFSLGNKQLKPMGDRLSWSRRFIVYG
jgi:hypothetical protein